MKQFRFRSYGMAPSSMKKFLPTPCATLPSPFTLKDIKSGSFSPSIMKRLKSAQHGTTIKVKTIWRGGDIWIKVIDKEAHKAAMKKKMAKIKDIKSSLKVCFKTGTHANEVKSCFQLLMKLEKIFGDIYMFPNVYCVNRFLEKL
jgi:hypothetical protein